MKKILIILIIVFVFISTGCSKNNEKDNKLNENVTKKENDNENMTNINVVINDKTYEAEIEDNETAQAFLNKLPKTFTMDELNGNEKYVYMDGTLPTNHFKPKHINAGDIMLYQNNCLVIFYKSFDTSYSYTKIGHINNLPTLDKDSIKVSFNK